MHTQGEGRPRKVTRHKYVRQDGKPRKHLYRDRTALMRQANRYAGLKGIVGSL